MNNEILLEGDLVQLNVIETSSSKKRVRGRNGVHNPRVLTINLIKDKIQNEFFGKIIHNDIIGIPNGSTITISKKAKVFAVRPKISDAMLSMPRGAAVVYPKDAGAIITYGDIRNGNSVLECGAGSGVLTLSLLEAVGETGRVVSIEKRDDFAKRASLNIKNYFGKKPLNHQIEQCPLHQFIYANKVLQNYGGFRSYTTFDNIVLDMLDPHNYLNSLAPLIRDGGTVTCYVTNVLQLSLIAKELNQNPQIWAQIECFEMNRREWLVEDIALRPKHQGIMHSGFLIFARKINNKTSREGVV